MSKTVILAINAKYIHSSLSVWKLAAGVSKYARLSHEVTVIESSINQQSREIINKIIPFLPNVIGISVYIWNAGKSAEILKLLKERLPNAVIVLGGPEASARAEYWLTRGASFVLRGEGERSFPAFLDMLDNNSSPESVSGLCWISNGNLYMNPVAEMSGDFVDPYSEAYYHALNGRIAYIEGSRGCPFQCAFCLSGGTGVRFLNFDVIKDQLRGLSQSGTKTIKFVDRTFNCDKDRAYELFQHIIMMDTACCFHFEVAADLFDERTISLLKTAPPGRIQLEAGLQSFYEPALRASLRKTNLSKAERNIRSILQGRNIHIHLDLIAGLPYETLQEFQNSFDRAYMLGAHTLQLGFLKLLYGSALRQQERSIICGKEPPYEIISSPWLSEDDLRIIKQTENSLQHTYNKGRFLSTLCYAISVSGIRPFSFYRALGEAAPNHGLALNYYAEQIYNYCVNLPRVEHDELKGHMILDWLSMVKGANMPTFMRISDRRKEQIAAIAEKQLGRTIRRSEVAVLPSGEGVFADSEKRDPVTKLYQLHFAEP